MSASSPFRMDGDNFYRWPPEPFEVERTYNRVSHYTRLLPGRHDRWDAGIIVDFALERIDDIKTQLDTPPSPLEFAFDQPWWDAYLKDCVRLDDRHIARGAAKGKQYNRWHEKNAKEWDQKRRIKQRLMAEGGIKLDELSKLGTDVHTQMERMARGLQPNAPVGTAVYDHVEYGRKFFDTFADAEIIGVELPVYSDEYGYAGQFDLLMVHNGKVILVDHKTSVNGIKPKTRVQCAFYKHADFVGKEDGTKIPMPKIDECWAVNVTRTKCTLTELNVDDSQWEAAKALIELYAWEKTQKTGMGKPALLSPLRPTRQPKVYK